MQGEEKNFLIFYWILNAIWMAIKCYLNSLFLEFRREASRLYL